MNRRRSAVGAIILVSLVLFGVELRGQSMTGTSGLFMTPTAQTMPDRTVILGGGYIPYGYTLYDSRSNGLSTYFVNVTYLPRVELMFRYAWKLGADRGPGISLFADRHVSGRVLVIKESHYVPAIVFGVHDPGKSSGVAANRYFGANYLVGTKHVDLRYVRAGVHVGYAFDLFGEPTQVFDGVFGGVSVSAAGIPGIELIAEHDSFRYNVAGRVLLFGRVQVMAGLLDLKDFSGNVSYRFGF